MSRVALSIPKGFMMRLIRSMGDSKAIEVSGAVYSEGVLDFLRFVNSSTVMFDDRDGRWVRVDKLEDFARRAVASKKEKE